MARPTVHDIAREAGVSLATVDRVLNGRPRVRESSIRLVQDAVEKLGYVRDVAAANLAKRKQYKFAFVLPGNRGQFVETLQNALNDAIAMRGPERTTLVCIPAPVDDPNAMARLLADLPAQGFDGLALMCPETPQVRDSVTRLKEAGLVVVTIVSDIPSSQRDRFVGVDNIAAGRTAGALMGRFLQHKTGKVLVISTSLVSRDSVERRFGFDSILSEQFPNIEVLPTIESQHDSVRLANILRNIVAANSDVIGIYSLGNGNAAILDAARAVNIVRSAAIIMHELTPVTRAALEADEVDVVIMQNVGHSVRSAIRILRAHVDRTEVFEPQERIRIEVVMKENLGSV